MAVPFVVVFVRKMNNWGILGSDLPAGGSLELRTALPSKMDVYLICIE